MEQVSLWMFDCNPILLDNLLYKFVGNRMLHNKFSHRISTSSLMDNWADEEVLTGTIPWNFWIQYYWPLYVDCFTDMLKLLKISVNS